MANEVELRKKEFLSYLRYLRSWMTRKKSNKEKFVLVSHYRSGSTLLVNLLNSHPRIYCDEEIFLEFTKLNFKKVLFPYAYIKYHAHIKYVPTKNRNPMYGFDIKVSQLIQILPSFQKKTSDFLWKLHQDGWKIIYLKRINVLRQAISALVGRSRGQWHDKPHGNLQRSTVSIDLSQLIDLTQQYENNLLLSDEILQKVPYCEIIYESDLLNEENHQQTLDRIFDYLGVESVSVKAQLKKVSQKNLSQDIENYQEVVDFISQTNYAKFLES